MASEIYACGADEACKSRVYLTYGLTAESVQIQEIAKEQINSTLKVYEGQDQYFAAREKWELCKTQQLNDAACNGYLQQANTALASAGIDPANVEVLDEVYHTYLINKVSQLHFQAAQDLQRCLDANPGNSAACEAFQKNVQSVLAYPGLTPAERTVMTKRANSYQSTSEYISKSNSELCAGKGSDCNPDALRQEYIDRQVALGNILPSDGAYLKKGWNSIIEQTLQINGAVAIPSLCEMIVRDSTQKDKCSDPAFAEKTIRPQLTFSQQALLNKAIGTYTVVNLVFAGSYDALKSYVSVHPELKIDPNLSESVLRAKLDSTLPEQLRLANAAPQVPRTLVEANPNSAYAQAYQVWKAEQMRMGRSTAGKTEQIWQEQFDRENQRALNTLLSEAGGATGRDDLTVARWQKGEVVPITILAQHEESLLGKPVRLEIPKWGIFSVVNSAIQDKPVNSYKIDLPVGKWITGVMKKTIENEFDVLGRRPDWYVSNKVQGKLELLSLQPEAKQQYLDAINNNPDAKKWMAENNATAEDYLTYQLEGYYRNEGFFAAGSFNKGTDSERMFIDLVMRGDVNVAKQTEKITGVSSVALTGFKTLDKIASVGLYIVTLGEQKSFTQAALPNLMNVRNQNIAKNVITAIKNNNSDQFTAWQNDPKQREAYELWKQSQPETTVDVRTGKQVPNDTSFEAFKVDQYRKALDVTARAQVGNYRVEAAKELFMQDPDWLTRAALNGYDAGQLNNALAGENQITADEVKKRMESLPQWNTLTADQRQRLGQQIQQQMRQEAIQKEAELIASAYIDNLDERTRISLQNVLAEKLKERGIATPPEEYQKQQLAAYLAHPDVQFLLGSGGREISLEGTLDGTFNMVRASQVYADIMRNDPWAAAAVKLNKFENGALLRGQQIRADQNASWFDRNIRAPVMMTAAPVGTVLSLAVPPLRVAQIGINALTTQTALAIAGEAMSIQMTGSSLQETAEVCTFDDMNAWACAQSAGMTLFAASGWLSSAGQLNTIARTSRIARLTGEAPTTNIITKFFDVTDTAIAQKLAPVAKFPVLSRFVSADAAVADLANFTRLAGRSVTLETLPGITAAERAAIKAGLSEAEQLALTKTVLTRESNRITQALAQTVYQSGPPSVISHAFTNGVGAVLFGTQALQTCGEKGIGLDCLMSSGLALVSASRLASAGVAAKYPESPLLKTIARADMAVNIGLAGTSCSAAVLGEGNAQHCATSLMMAGLSVGHIAAESARTRESPFANPFAERMQAIEDAAALTSAKTIGPSDILFKGKLITVNSENRAELLADVQTRLGQSQSAVAKAIGQTNLLITQFRNNKNIPKDEKYMSFSQRQLRETALVWEKLVNPDGTVNTIIEVNGNRRVVTPDMLDNTQKLLQQLHEQVQYELVLTRNPRTAVEQIVDRIASRIGRTPKIVSDFNAALARFTEAARSADTKPLEYEVARADLEAARTAVERSRMTRQQQRDAAQLDAAVKEVNELSDKQEVIRLRIALLENPESLAEALTIRASQLSRASNQLADLLASGAEPKVTEKAREMLQREQALYESVQRAATLNGNITNEAQRFTVIANESVQLAPLSAREAEIRTRIVALEQSIASANTVRGRVAEFFAELRGTTRADQLTEARLKAEDQGRLLPKVQTKTSAVRPADLTKARVMESDVTLENGKKAIILATEGLDRTTRRFVEEANKRLIRVQEELGFPLHDRSINSQAPQDQVYNALLGAMSGEESLFLRIKGGGGKTITSVLMAAERVHYTGRKQLVFVEAGEVLTDSKKIFQYDAVFAGEGVKRFYLTKKVGDLTPAEFRELMDADVIMTTNKVAYEAIRQYGKGTANPAQQSEFIAHLQSGKGFEIIADEVALLKSNLTLSVSGDTVVHTTTPQGKRDLERLINVLGYQVDEATGQLRRVEAPNKPVARFVTDGIELFKANRMQGLRTVFEPELLEVGEYVIRQYIRARTYRDILLELKKTYPEAADNIDRMLGELADPQAFERAIASGDKTVLSQFEERVNGIRTADVVRDEVMRKVQTDFLEQVDMFETVGTVFQGVVGNSYEPIARLDVAADGRPIESFVVVPKERNVDEGKQISDGMQNMIYNTVGKELYGILTDNPNITANISDVRTSRDVGQITMLAFTTYAKRVSGMSLDANVAAGEWSGAVPKPELVGDTGILFLGQDGRPSNAAPKTIWEVNGVADIGKHLKTRAAAQQDNQAGIVVINGSGVEVANIDAREVVKRHYGDSAILVRNRNNQHQVEVVAGVQQGDGEVRTVEAVALRIEPVEVGGERQFRVVRERIERVVNQNGKTSSERVVETTRMDPVKELPIQLSDLDVVKLALRGETITDATQLAALRRVEALLGKSIEKSFYVDYYEKGADVGVDPLSFSNESVRVIGDRFTADYEWEQARMRVRGNEGGTAPVYTKFSPDTEFVVIGTQDKEVSLPDFVQTTAQLGRIKIQQISTATRLQFLNERMVDAVEQLSSVLSTQQARDQARSLLDQGKRRLNTRIGAVAVDTEAELARQARIVQETIDQVANLPEIQKLARGGFLGIGRNRAVADIVNSLTKANGRPIIDQLPERLQFRRASSKTSGIADLIPAGIKRFVAERGAAAQAPKPYTQGKNMLEIVRLMEQNTVINDADPYASDVVRSVTRGINEVKTALVAANTQQDIARSRQVAIDATKTIPDIMQVVRGGLPITQEQAYRLRIAQGQIRQAQEVVRTTRAALASLPVLSQTIRTFGQLRVGDTLVVNAQLVGGAVKISNGTTVSWKNPDGSEQVLTVTDATPVSLAQVPLNVAVVIDVPEAAAITLPEFDAGTIVTDSNKRAVDFVKHEQLSTELKQQEAALFQLSGGVTAEHIDEILASQTTQSFSTLLAEEFGIPAENISDTAEYAAARAAYAAYQERVSEVVQSLNSRALEGNPITIIERETQPQYAALEGAIESLLINQAPRIKDAAQSKAFSNLGIVRSARVNQTITLSDGGVVRVVEENTLPSGQGREATKQLLVAAAKAQTDHITAAFVKKLTDAVVAPAVAYQKKEIARLVRREKPGIFARGLQSVLPLLQGVLRLPSSFADATRWGAFWDRWRERFARRDRQPQQPTAVLEGVEAVIAGLGNGQYAQAYNALRSATAARQTENIDKLTAAIRADIARRLGSALGVQVNADHEMVTAILEYESGFTSSAITDEPQGATLTAFTEEVNDRPLFADEKTGLRTVAIGRIQEFLVAQQRAEQFTAAAVFGIVTDPSVRSVFAFTHPEATTAQGAGSVATVDDFRQALANRNYIEAYRVYEQIRANALKDPNAFDHATKLFQQDVADRLSRALEQTVEWSNAAVVRIAEYERAILAFTDRIAADPAVVDYESFFNAAHADAAVQDALAQAKAAFDSLALAGMTQNAYEDGILQTIDPVMQSVWEVMRLDDRIAARTEVKQQTASHPDIGWLALLSRGFGEGYRYTLGANPLPGVRAFFRRFSRNTSPMSPQEKLQIGETLAWMTFRGAGLTGHPVGIATSIVTLAWDALRIAVYPIWHTWNTLVHPTAGVASVTQVPDMAPDADMPSGSVRRLLWETNPFAYGVTGERLSRTIPWLVVRGFLYGANAVPFLWPVTGPVGLYTLYQDLTAMLPPQTRINIANGSGEGFFEHIWNATPVVKSINPVLQVRALATYIGTRSIPIIGQAMFLRDLGRLGAVIFRIKPAQSLPTRTDPAALWRTDWGYRFHDVPIIGRWINGMTIGDFVHATPNNHPVAFAVSRGLVHFVPIVGNAIGLGLNFYDTYRFIEGGGWQWILAQPADHFSRNRDHFFTRYILNPRPIGGGWGERLAFIGTRWLGFPIAYDVFRAIRWVRESVFHGEIPAARAPQTAQPQAAAQKAGPVTLVSAELYAGQQYQNGSIVRITYTEADGTQKTEDGILRLWSRDRTS